jgi:hypothetical protein
MLFLLTVLTAIVSAAPVDFQRQVRPILSDACFHCHGPDQNTRMAGLRLDTRDGAAKVIVAGDALASKLYQRVVQEKPALRMPPVHTKKSLTDAQKETLRQWIAQGADWKEHWSFQPPVKRTPPSVKGAAWVRNPIDRFVLARLEADGLAPAPMANRRTLIRRVTLDLTGLPPTPAEVEAFVADKSPTAYEKVVDRLLQSKHWGEHRGRYWLDAARYADTHGLHIDNYREMWPYRDWVIQAFNRNLPFDRFTIEQLAGDMLPERTLEQQIASGFNRNNITTNEGGVIPDEVDAMYQKDRVETTSTVWLGLTTGCATCHDHKFDPISQKEFYQMVAFFKNTTQRPLDGNIPDTPPVIVVPREEDRVLWASLEERQSELRAQRERVVAEANPAFTTWLAGGGQKEFREPVPAADEWLSLALNEGSGSVLRGRLQGAAVTVESPVEWDTRGARLTGKQSLTVPGVPEFSLAKPFTFGAWIKLSDSEDSVVVASHTDAKTQSRGWILDIGNRQPRFVFASGDGKKLQTRGSNVQRVRVGAWTHLAVVYDGSGEEAGITLYMNGKPMAMDQVPPDPSEEVKPADASRMALRLGSDGKRFFGGSGIEDVRLYSRALSDDEMQMVALWQKPDEKLWELVYLNRLDANYQAVASQMDEVERERRAVRRRGAVTHVMQEKPDGKAAARILYRGQYDQPREEVYPDVPSALPGMSKELPRNRFGLAQWLIDPNNPLTARVTVNRFWQEVFGHGLVRTSEDFGSQGQPPTHPELLDWLALEFRDKGWDMKALFRLLVTSSTYRQSAAATELKLKKDPENRLLSRGPRYRMDAEMVRDFALASSGLLVREIGGPSVRPYQPEGVWETVAMRNSTTRFYKQDSGDKLYRRSMYTFWKRSAPPASMEIFNAPSRENCTVRRERTNTPLQALVTMNDVQFVEAARYLAGQAMGAIGFDKRLDYLTTRLLARRFNAQERAIAKASYNGFVSHYQSQDAEAEKLLATGASPVAKDLPAVEHAAWTMVANQLMNLDEALNK